MAKSKPKAQSRPVELKGGLRGSFLCLGARIEPIVILLSASEMDFMSEKMKIAETRCKDRETARAGVYRHFFTDGVEYAIPAWSQDALLSLVEHYEGANAAQVKKIAACLYERKPWSEYRADLTEGGGPTNPQGGQKAPIDPVKPKPRSGGGATVEDKLNANMRAVAAGVMSARR